jgi:hypothetical protein
MQKDQTRVRALSSSVAVAHLYFTTVRCAPRSIAPSSVATAASMVSPWRRYFGFLACREKKIFHFSWSGTSGGESKESNVEQFAVGLDDAFA